MIPARFARSARWPSLRPQPATALLPGATLLLAACSGGPGGPTCDAASLGRELDAAEASAPSARVTAALDAIRHSCPGVPEGVLAETPVPSSWKAACTAPAPTDAASLATAWTECKLADKGLGTSDDAVLAIGRPATAAALRTWLGARVDEALATRAALAVRGGLPWVLPEGATLTLPAAGGAAAPIQAPVAVVPDGLYVDGALLVALAGGLHPPSEHPVEPPFPAWASPQLRAKASPELRSFALDASVPVETLRRIATAVADRGDAFTVIVAAEHGSRGLILHLPAGRDTDAPVVHLAGGFDRAALDAVAKGPAVVLDPTGTTSVGDLVAAAAAAEGRFDRIVLSIPDDAPCGNPLPGMVCIPGGAARVSGNPKDDNQGPKRDIYVSTFYLDTHEATNARYAACVEAGGCTSVNRKGAPEAAAGGLTWTMARQYCAWAGKRLPSEWEWEKAARGPEGEEYPWGNAPPTCDRAIYADCGVSELQAPGTRAAGRQGLYDMAGNAAEWTKSLGIRNIGRCGDRCTGTDPIGPCDGAYPCPGYYRPIVRGGSFDGDVDSLSASRRAMVAEDARPQRLGVRCATDGPWLTRWPPRRVEHPLSAGPDLQPPDPALVTIFEGMKEDPIETKPICENEGGRSSLDCRDPNSYVKGNEPRGHLFKPFIRNLGGGYVGVASDQNYNYAALARAEWAWFLDYDPNVVHVHKVNKALIKASDTPEAFVARYADDAAESSLALIEAEWAGDPELEAFKRNYRVFRKRLFEWYTREIAPPTSHVGLGGVRVPEGDPEVGWLRNPGHYAWIRSLWQQGRARAVKGDMLGNVSLQEIGRSAREMGVTVRIYYTSNAPNAWGGAMTDEYRANVRGFPMDEESVVLQVLGFPTGFGQEGYWHYHVSNGLQHQHRLGLPGYTHVWKLVTERIPTDDPDLTVIGLASD